MAQKPVHLGAELQVSTSTGYPTISAVDMSPAGDFVVVWRGGGYYSGKALARRFDASGTALGGEFIVGPAGSNRNPDVGLASSGAFEVIWQESNYNPSPVYAQRYDSAGAPAGARIDVDEQGGSDLRDPVMASDDSGNFVVTWTRDVYYGTDSILARAFNSDGSPASGQLQVNQNGSSLRRSDVARNGSGAFVVVWRTSYYYGSGIEGRLFDSSGAPTGGEFNVDDGSAGFGDDPSVAINPSGDFVVTWESRAGYYNAIAARRFDSTGSPRGGQFFVNPSATDESGQGRDPAVAMDSAGNFTVVWRESGDYSVRGVVGRSFDSAGQPVGGQFEVDVARYGPEAPAIAMKDSGEFVVTWSAGNDYYGSRYVMAQRFAPPPFRLVSPAGLTAREGDAVTLSVDATGGGPFSYQWRKDGAALSDGGPVSGATTADLSIHPVSLSDAGDYDCLVTDASMPPRSLASDPATLTVLSALTPVRSGPELGPAPPSQEAQRYPAVGSGATGTFVIAWVARVGSYASGLFARRYDSDGSALGGELRVDTPGSGNPIDPHAGSDGSGRFVVVWSAGAGIFAQRFDDAGAKIGGQFQVNSFSSDFTYSPAVGMDDSGNFVVAWTGRPPSSAASVFAKRYTSTGQSSSQFRVNFVATDVADTPSIGMAGSGEFVVAWQRRNGYPTNVFARRFTSTGAPRGADFAVGSPTSDRRIQPRAAMDDTGAFTIVWATGAGYYSDQIHGRRFTSAGQPVGGEFPVNTTPLKSPLIGLDTDSLGEFIVTWQSKVGSSSEILGQFFDGDGAARGSEFTVNAMTAGPQGRPAVAMAPGGDFMVAWESGQYSASEVRAQLFSSQVPPPNSPPTADAGEDQDLECTSASGAEVILDGTNSSDPDSTPGTRDDIVSYRWIENAGQPAETVLGEGEILNIVLPLGRHEITLLVSDSQGETDTDEVVVTVADTTPPAITMSLDPRSLWPPNNKLAPVHATVMASDACGTPSVVLTSIFSSEDMDGIPAPQSDTGFDIQEAEIGTADFDFLLRAQRQGRGLGRIYMVTYTAVDASGLSADASGTVTVAHDRGLRRSPNGDVGGREKVTKRP